MTRHASACGLLRFDALAGLTAGVLMLLLHGWLTALYRLPGTLVWFVTLMNLLYGATSATLVLVQPANLSSWMRRMGSANVVWAMLCSALAIAWGPAATAFGIAALLGEALFVGSLGLLEWRVGRDLR
jgi:hypothetical protein